MIISRESEHIQKLNEMYFNSLNGLPTNVENSVYYPKLKSLLHGEIVSFTKEKLTLRSDLQFLRLNVGNVLEEKEIREYLNKLKDDYNNKDSDIGIEYHIESTRVDYGVPVFCTIRRGEQIYMKKFVFRFRKKSVGDSLNGLAISGTPISIGEEIRRVKEGEDK